MRDAGVDVHASASARSEAMTQSRMNALGIFMSSYDVFGRKFDLPAKQEHRVFEASGRCATLDSPTIAIRREGFDSHDRHHHFGSQRVSFHGQLKNS
jgi:hypothetical protein